jgi:antitoxin component HigA of HigAB toxin-antitoxin module
MTALLMEKREYLRLTRKTPPRPLHTPQQYREAVVAANRLAVRDEASLSAAEADYLDALATFISKYEDEHVPEPPPGSALERLRFIIESAGMSASDLGRLLGNRGLGSTLLAGKRELSKTHIRVLAEHFHLDAAYFL